MKSYLLSLGAGLLVGIVYALLKVRSPAPPVIALVGLLGILVGEQIVPVAQRIISGDGLSVSWIGKRCGAHVFGELPQGKAAEKCEQQTAARPTTAG